MSDISKVRAKFTVSSITTYQNTTDVTVKLNPVYEDNKEDNHFSKYTPSGEIVMYVSNPPVVEFMPVGKKFYVDFTPVEG